MASPSAPKGLTPAQLKKFNEIATSSDPKQGAKHAADWAINQVRQNKANAAAGNPPVDPNANGGGPSGGGATPFIDPGLNSSPLDKNGQLDYSKDIKSIIDTAHNNYITSIKSKNPDQTDQYGNKLHYEYNPDGTISAITTAGDKENAAIAKRDAAAAGYTGIDLSKAPKVLSEGDLTDQYNSDYAARLDNATQFNDRNQARDVEDTRQQLAQRGIPFDPAFNDPNNPSGYAKALSGVKEHYDTLNRTAMNDATTGAHADVAQQVDSSVKGYNAWLAGQTSADSDAQFALGNDRQMASDYAGNFSAFNNNSDFDTSPYILQLDTLLQNGHISQQDHDDKVAALKEQTRVDSATINKLNKPTGSGSAPKSSGSAGGGFEFVS